MKCKICNQNETDAIRYYVWINDGDWKPFIDAETFIEWLARSGMKHKKMSVEEAKDAYKKSLFSGDERMLKIIQAKVPRASEWKIIYDYTCAVCQKIVHASKT